MKHMKVVIFFSIIWFFLFCSFQRNIHSKNIT